MKKPRVLICDDEPDVRIWLGARLAASGYDVADVGDGAACLSATGEQPPDLIVLDINMPGMDGFAVCKELRRNPQTRSIPVVMLTAYRTELDDRVRGLRLGADDYLPKTIDPAELTARLATIMRRSARSGDVNPLTKLPGNAIITEEIERRLASRKPFGVLWIDLDNFKSFNDRYGFTRGDKMIVETAKAIQRALAESGGEGDFLGHVGGDDFVVVCEIERSTVVAEHVAKLVDERLPPLYDLDDRARGFIRAIDRNGNPLSFPVTTASIAIVHSQVQRFQNVLQVAEAANETKKLAKARRGSGVYVDRRMH